MAIHAPTAVNFTQGQQAYMQSTVLPAPIGGIDGRLNLASNNPSNCIYAYNLVPTEYGMQIREGYREWAIAVRTAPEASFGVRTLIPFDADTTVADNKLFAVTNEGIWDVSTYNTVAPRVVTFSDTSNAAGWGHFTHYTTDAGETLLLYTDSANGYYTYSRGTDTWTQITTEITGADATKFAFVVSHKQRIWFIERDSNVAYYLPIGAIQGAVTPFYFASKFKYGGSLVGLYNWTLDSGAGVDDKLVAVSSAGDVIPYEGEDPAFASSWSTIGTFYIGETPVGRRIANEYGGDLYLLSAYGVTAMSDLLAGVAGTAQENSLSLKISRFIRTDMEQYRNDRGWEISFYPNQGILLISTPQRIDNRYIQYRANLSVKGWGFWRDVPMNTSVSYDGHLMVGTEDARVVRMDINVDNSTFAAPEGQAIEFSMLWNFFDMDQPGRFKWGEFVRPNWLSVSKPFWTTRFLYDYDTRELVNPGAAPSREGDVWDTGTWDDALWASGSLVPFTGLTGSWGPGRTMAVAMRGSSRARAILASIDVLWRAGGPF